VVRQINKLTKKDVPVTVKDCPRCISRIPLKATKCPCCTADIAAG
jgi:large conductance mechanosensitive channel